MHRIKNILPVLFLLGGAAPLAAGVTIISEGAPRAAVILPEHPGELETRAAEELVSHLELISGAALPVVSGAPPAGLLPLRLGTAAPGDLAALARARGDNPSSFALSVTEEGVSIRGAGEEGTLFGVYELLEQLGVRWYHPGEQGRVLPAPATNIRLRRQQTIQAPDMAYRQLQHVEGDWTHRVRLGGAARPTGAHRIPPFQDREARAAYFASNPEYFGLVDGRRQPRQLCLSHPDVLRLTIDAVRRRLRENPEQQHVPMAPNDGQHGYCECDGCRALDRGVFDPFRFSVSMTDRYIWFFNQVLEALEPDFPDLRLVWYVYGLHIMPPETRPHPHIIHVIAPLTLDRVRGMDNPLGPDRHMLRWFIESWRALTPADIYYRGYYYNLACPQFPFSQLDRIRHETPAFHEMGIRVMRIETRPSWSTQTPALYLAARMMWDINTDVDALLAEFYDKFYGPAREPMRRYHETLEAAFRDTPYFTGSSYLYLPIFMEHPRRQELREALAAAGEATGEDNMYAARVAAVRLAWDRLECFLDMIAARNRFDFAAAADRADHFAELTDRLTGHVLEEDRRGGRRSMRLLVWRERTENRRNMFNRFFAPAVRAGYQRAVVAGEIVATLPDQWLFMQDPVRVGEMSGYQRPGPLGGNWQPLRTTSRSWSDQGLHHYKHMPAWYRAAVTIPERFHGRPLYLWFGGVDDHAHVWVNGQFVGSSREPGAGLPGTTGSFQPFDLAVTDAVRWGGENWVVVKIENERIVERGTGGIVAPVMFWSPEDHGWRPDN